MSSKDFDLIVFGATSFTGKLVVEYLDNNYKDNISWALAGRNKEKLEAVKEQLSCDAPILIIDSESQNDIQNAQVRYVSLNNLNEELLKFKYGFLLRKDIFKVPKSIIPIERNKG